MKKSKESKVVRVVGIDKAALNQDKSVEIKLSPEVLADIAERQKRPKVDFAPHAQDTDINVINEKGVLVETKPGIPAVQQNLQQQAERTGFESGIAQVPGQPQSGNNLSKAGTSMTAQQKADAQIQHQHILDPVTKKVVAIGAITPLGVSVATCKCGQGMVLRNYGPPNAIIKLWMHIDPPKECEITPTVGKPFGKKKA